MVKKKACKKCKVFVTGNSCQLCKGEVFTTNWVGRVYVLDPEKSIIAQNTHTEAKGEYAIKIK